MAFPATGALFNLTWTRYRRPCQGGRNLPSTPLGDAGAPPIGAAAPSAALPTTPGAPHPPAPGDARGKGFLRQAVDDLADAIRELDDALCLSVAAVACLVDHSRKGVWTTLMDTVSARRGRVASLLAIGAAVMVGLAFAALATCSLLGQVSLGVVCAAVDLALACVMVRASERVLDGRYARDLNL